MGVASGLTNTSRQIGGSIGLAVVSSIAATASSHYAHSHALPAFSSPALTHGFHVAFYTHDCWKGRPRGRPFASAGCSCPLLS
jgi:hypothetical protein